MNDSSYNPRKSSGSTSSIILLGIVLLPVLYVLSLGPLIVVVNRGWLGPLEGPVHQSLAIIYLPLALCLQEQIPVVAPALEWYVSLWVG